MIRIYGINPKGVIIEEDAYVVGSSTDTFQFLAANSNLLFHFQAHLNIKLFVSE